MSGKFRAKAAGVLSVGVVTLAMGAAGVIPTPTTAATGDGAASISGLTPAQKKAKQRALKACNKIKNRAKRRACVVKVNKRYRPKPVIKVGATVGVNDDYFSPSDVVLKKGEGIKWVWNNANVNAHNVTLVSSPAGLTAKQKYELSTPNSPAVQYTFGPKVLPKTGEYDFVCSLHSTVMIMKVKVTN